MAGEIIRKGDSTSHNGTVIEGSMSDICMGKPIAYLGHKVYCPKCKGDFPIVEGVMTTTFYGKGVALAGMKTSCGATLIASQFTDTVEWGQGKPHNSLSNPANHDSPSKTVTSDISSTNEAQLAESRSIAPPNRPLFNERFILLDDTTGQPLANTEYAILRGSKKIEYGTTDANGHTHILSATAEAEPIEIYT